MSPLRAKSIKPVTASSLFLAFLLWGVWGSAAWAAQSRADAQEGPQPCAVVESYRGLVQVMDPGRTHLIEPQGKAAVPCGGWVSVGKGRAEIAHRDGYRIHLSANSFVQLPENNVDGKYSGDPLVVYRGQAYVRALSGAREFRGLTANGRVRIPRGAAIVLYNQAQDETQVVALEGTVFFENRFQAVRRVKVAPGEASSLNLQQARVVPSAPKAIAQSVLRPRLLELAVGERESRFALRKARERADRKFASAFAVAKAEKEDSLVGASLDDALAGSRSDGARRGLASMSGSKGAVPKVDAQLHGHLARRLAGGIELGEKMLLSENGGSRSQRVRLEVEDPAERYNQKARKHDEIEKRKLIEELSQIRVD